MLRKWASFAKASEAIPLRMKGGMKSCEARGAKEDGAAREDRTLDLSLTKGVLYH